MIENSSFTIILQATELLVVWILAIFDVISHHNRIKLKIQNWALEIYVGKLSAIHNQLFILSDYTSH